MLTFSEPRTASDIAAVVLGPHNDDEIPSDIINGVLTRIHARVDLLAGSTANQEAKDNLVQRILTRVVRSPLEHGEDPRFSNLDQFESLIRLQVNLHCGALGKLRNRDF
ncbi:MAG: hypothetical protein AAFN70_07270 [Planctomycetota bacterium]